MRKVETQPETRADQGGRPFVMRIQRVLLN